MSTETREQVKVRAEVWEADEEVVTVNGKPVGQTLSKRYAGRVARWLENALPSILATLDQPPLAYESEDGELICPTGGCRVEVVSGNEGTCYYRPSAPPQRERGGEG